MPTQVHPPAVQFSSSPLDAMRSDFAYKKDHPFEKRAAEATRIREK